VWPRDARAESQGAIPYPAAWALPVLAAIPPALCAVAPVPRWHHQTGPWVPLAGASALGAPAAATAATSADVAAFLTTGAGRPLVLVDFGDMAPAVVPPPLAAAATRALYTALGAKGVRAVVVGAAVDGSVPVPPGVDVLRVEGLGDPDRRAVLEVASVRARR
jgi:hypothetical protein